MNTPLRFLTAEDADVLARTTVERTSSKGCVEVHGLTWKSDALLAWEIRQRDMGKTPKVDVRLDELDLSVVFVNVPDIGVGPFRGISRQPYFTERLSLFELRRLKAAVKDKALAERLGRLSDEEATKLRIEFYALLGHGSDPAARKRLSEVQHELANLRLKNIQTVPVNTQMPAEPSTPKARKKSASNKANAATPVDDDAASPVDQVWPVIGDNKPTSPPPALPVTLLSKPEVFSPRPKYPSISLKRTPL